MDRNDPKGSPEFERFNALVGKVMSVPSDTVKKRIEADRETSKAQADKRKSKPKANKLAPR
jgi:hypothetical protein